MAGIRPRKKYNKMKKSGSGNDSQIMDWYADELDRRFHREYGCHCSWCRRPCGNRQLSHNGVFARHTVRLLRRAKTGQRRGVPEPLD